MWLSHGLRGPGTAERGEAQEGFAQLEVATVLDGGRYATDGPGYAAMLRHAQRWPERVWAVEGCRGIGRHVAVRLLADGEQIVGVPPKLSARVRVFSTGQGRKTDATDAHSVALVGTRMAGLRRACQNVCVSA